MQPGTEGYILYDSTDKMFWKRQTYTDSDHWLSGTAGRGREKRHGRIFWYDNNVLYFDSGSAYTTYFLKTIHTIYFKRMNLTFCKFHVHKLDFLNKIFKSTQKIRKI